jgi:hypothetical protein
METELCSASMAVLWLLAPRAQHLAESVAVEPMVFLGSVPGAAILISAVMEPTGR